jgi:pimeloyl-ACP methyl ester carboxylesterase
VPEGTGTEDRGGAFHRLVDRLAMAFEDRVARRPVPWRPGPDLPLDPSGPPLPLPPVRRTPARGERRGTAVLVPPWKIRTTAALRGWVRPLAEEGFEVWIPVPPLHLERTPPGERSGEGVLGPDLARTREALRTAVREVRGCLASAGEDGGQVVLVGLSLGGLVAAWAATGPERVDAAALVAPPADLAAVFRGTAIGRRYAALAGRAGAPVPDGEELDRRLAWLSPLHRAPTAGRLLVAGGLHDAIALGGAAALARSWNAPLREYRRGHLTLLLACAAVRRDVADFAADRGSGATSSRRAARP